MVESKDMKTKITPLSNTKIEAITDDSSDCSIFKNK